MLSGLSATRKFSRVSGLVLLLCLAGVAGAQKPAPADQAFLAAYDAYRAGSARRFAIAASGLEGHVLRPWIDYWQLGLELDQSTPESVEQVLARHAGSYAADRLRADWLKVLAKRRDWERFGAQRPLLVRDDTELRCMSAHAGLQREDPEGADAARRLWMEPGDFTPGCAAMAEELARRGLLSQEAVWLRMRMLFAAGQMNAMRYALRYLPRAEQPFEGQLGHAQREPDRLIAELASTRQQPLERRGAREAALYAGLRIARDDPTAAASALAGRLGVLLAAEERSWLWGQLAWRAAMRLEERALDWYARAAEAKTVQLSDEQLAWKARAALRAGNWRVVKEAIDAMSLEAKRESSWIYWYGRALASEGNTAGARAWFQRIAGGTDFYALLAMEELGYAPALPAAAYQPAEEEVVAIAAREGLVRALALFRLGLRSEGVREWVFSLRGLDDRQLLAASELARRAELYDRAIATAERTVALHNFGMRYPAPYREVFGEFARAVGLEEALVLGIARQESRFIASARSVAGAQGLMQLMPATARWVAAKSGMKDYLPAQVSEVRTNVTLGTRYLKMVLDSLGHPILATAAYNAGPGRARRWRDARPLEGAIYAESIPFSETRDYVKRVMANAAFYGALLQGSAFSFKQRLGQIAAREGAEQPEILP